MSFIEWWIPYLGRRWGSFYQMTLERLVELGQSFLGLYILPDRPPSGFWGQGPRRAPRHWRTSDCLNRPCQQSKVLPDEVRDPLVKRVMLKSILPRVIGLCKQAGVYRMRSFYIHYGIGESMTLGVHLFGCARLRARDVPTPCTQIFRYLFTKHRETLAQQAIFTWLPRFLHLEKHTCGPWIAPRDSVDPLPLLLYL